MSGRRGRPGAPRAAGEVGSERDPAAAGLLAPEPARTDEELRLDAETARTKEDLRLDAESAAPEGEAVAPPGDDERLEPHTGASLELVEREVMVRLVEGGLSEDTSVPTGEPREGALVGVPDGNSADEEPAEPEAAPVDPFGPERLVSIVESVLFASDKPLNALQLAELIGLADLGPVKSALLAIEAAWQPRGVQLHAVAGGYQFRTTAANAPWVQKMLAQKPVRLTRAQLETLAICAYRQPITRPEIDEIRGVDSAAAVKSLLDRSLVRILGKREEPGRPLLFGTTREFLDFFSLSDLRDLPTLREFHELTEEHRAQVAALEEKAPAGSVETVEEAMAAAARRPLERVTFEPPPEDAAELDEIDRLISTAGGERVVLDPTAPSTEQPTAPTTDRARK